MKIGILGGSFDPVHYGHLMLANMARNELNLDLIEFVPSYKSPAWYKQKSISHFHRVHMLTLALKNTMYNHVDMIEIERKRTSYTIDTIRYFREKYKKDKLFLITGPDVIYTIDKWKNIDKIRKLVEVKIALHDFYCSDTNIRSILIRWLQENRKPIKYLVPPEVENYILVNNLYRKK